MPRFLRACHISVKGVVLHSLPVYSCVKLSDIDTYYDINNRSKEECAYAIVTYSLRNEKLEENRARD